MADAIAELDGLDPSKRTEPEAISARAEVLVADLVEPSRATTLDKLDEGRQGLEIATAWLRSKMTLGLEGGLEPDVAASPR